MPVETDYFRSLMKRYQWRPIPGCAGRYILKGGVLLTGPPEDLLGDEIPVEEARFPGAVDPVFFARFSGGGLISFQKKDGYIHTLCDPGGMERKMKKFGGKPLNEGGGKSFLPVDPNE